MAKKPMGRDDSNTIGFTLNTTNLSSDTSASFNREGHVVVFKIAGKTAVSMSTDNAKALGTVDVKPAAAVYFPAIINDTGCAYAGYVSVSSSSGQVTLNVATSIASGKRIAVSGSYWVD